MMFSWFKKSPRKETTTSTEDNLKKQATLKKLSDESAKVEREYLNYLDELKQTSLEEDYVLPYKVVRKLNPLTKDTSHWLYEHKEGKDPVKLCYIPKGPDNIVDLKTRYVTPRLNSLPVIVEENGYHWDRADRYTGYYALKVTEQEVIVRRDFRKAYACIFLNGYSLEIPYQLRDQALDQLINQLKIHGFKVNVERT